MGPEKQQEIPKRFVPTKKIQASLSHPKSMNHTTGPWEWERMLFFGILENFPFVANLSIHFPHSSYLPPPPRSHAQFFCCFYFAQKPSDAPPPPPASGTGNVRSLFQQQDCGLTGVRPGGGGRRPLRGPRSPRSPPRNT